MLGDIFREKFGKDPKNLTIEEIEKLAIKKLELKEYAKSLVIQRGNIFDLKEVNIDSLIDSLLKKPFISK